MNTPAANTSRVIKAAVIGCGGISSVHLRFLASRKEVRVVGLCDVNGESLRSRQEEFGGKGYEDFRVMLDEARPDAVWLCTPPQVRREPLLACAERGVPVFCEKPVEREEGKAREIAGSLARLGAKVQIGYVFRSMPSVQRLRKEIASDRIHCVHSFYGCGISISMDLRSWFYDKALSGGALVDQATHNFDLMRYLLGEVEEVRGLARNPVRPKADGYTIDEAISLSFAFASGAVGSHTHTWVGNGWRNEMAFSGQKRFYRLDPVCGRLTIEEGAETSIFQQDPRPIHDFQNDVFLSMVMAGDWGRNPCDYEDGANTLHLTLACDRSLAEAGGAIRLRSARRST